MRTRNGARSRGADWETAGAATGHGAAPGPPPTLRPTVDPLRKEALDRCDDGVTVVCALPAAKCRRRAADPSYVRASPRRRGGRGRVGWRSDERAEIKRCDAAVRASGIGGGKLNDLDASLLISSPSSIWANYRSWARPSRKRLRPRMVRPRRSRSSSMRSTCQLSDTCPLGSGR